MVNTLYYIREGGRQSLARLWSDYEKVKENVKKQYTTHMLCYVTKCLDNYSGI